MSLSIMLAGASHQQHVGSQKIALAAFNPCTTKASWFAGYISPSSAYKYGSSALIEYANPALCGSDDTGGSASTAWSMVSSQSVINGAGMWAQAGYGQFGDGENFIATFSQYTTLCKALGTCATPAGKIKTEFDGTNPTGAWTYWVQFQGSGDRHLHMKVNNLQLDETGYDPTNYWDAAWNNQFAGEVKHQESDVVGIQSDKITFTALETENAAGDWNPINNDNLSPGYPTTARYYKQFYGVAHAFRIWTDPLHY